MTVTIQQMNAILSKQGLDVEEDGEGGYRFYRGCLLVASSPDMANGLISEWRQLEKQMRTVQEALVYLLNDWTQSAKEEETREERSAGNGNRDAPAIKDQHFP